MTRAELAERMARVAVAIKRHATTFSVDARPFGDGWAVFVDGNHDVAWLECSARGATEEQACDGAWTAVRHALRKAYDKRMDDVREHGASLARAEFDVALYAAARRAG